MQYYAIVPAAGTGSRMGGDQPKQYLPLAGKPVLWHALSTLLACSQLAKVCVVISPKDEYWGRYDWSDLGSRLKVLPVGGANRAASVSNALAALDGELSEHDWVLVHDAARALLSQEDLQRLMDSVQDDAVGGLLAVPVADTLKRARPDGRVAATVPRDQLWQAQTPQMFHYALLRLALAAAPGVTDEAGAIESLGLAPRLVEPSAPNFKITYPQDLLLAEQVLQSRAKHL